MSLNILELEGRNHLELARSAGIGLGINPEFLMQMFLPPEILQSKTTIVTTRNTSHAFTFTGVRIVVAPQGGDVPSQGGLKVASNVFGGEQFYTATKQPNLELLYGLAFDMSRKHWLLQTGYAGAKAAIEVPDALIANQQLMQILLHKWARDFGREVLWRTKGGIGPDVGTGPYMGSIVSGLIDDRGNPERVFPFRDALASVSGKPLDLGGLEIRNDSTGIGVAKSAMWLIDKLRAVGKFTEKILAKIGIQGSGNVGLSTLKTLEENDYIVTTMSSLSVDGIPIALYCQEGLSAKLIKPLLDNRGRIDTAKLVGDSVYRDYRVVVGDYLFGDDINVFIPCAGEGKITDTFLCQMPKLVGIIEGANSPLQSNAQEYAIKNEIQIVPAIVANSLGVNTSCLERETANLLPAGVTAETLKDFAHLKPTYAVQLAHLEAGFARSIATLERAEQEFQGVGIYSAIMYLYVLDMAEKRVAHLGRSRSIVTI
jgi:glutamate dehydrogenase (NAD(P)+)